MRNEFSTTDIFKALGIPRERLKDWMMNDFVEPTVPAKGKGIPAVFTKSDIYLIALFQDLIQKGFKRLGASIVVKYLKKKFDNMSEIYYIMVTWAGEIALPINISVLGPIKTLKLDLELGRPKTAINPKLWSVPVTEELIDKMVEGQFEEMPLHSKKEFKQSLLKLESRAEVEFLIKTMHDIFVGIKELENMFPDQYPPSGSWKDYIGNKLWDDIILINFLNLRNKVNRSLS